MPRLEVFENKKLVLKNILRRELKNIQLEMLDEEVNKFDFLLNKLAVQKFGPLVMKSSGIKINDDSVVTMDYDLLIQAHNYQEFKSAFEPIDQLEIANCIYVHFEGNPEDIQFAHSKLDLYFYENDVVQSGDTYSVVIEDSSHHAIVDIFRPVINL